MPAFSCSEAEPVVEALMEEVGAADEASEGYTQLAHHLNKLSSKVIEQKLLVFGAERQSRPRPFRR